MAWRAKKRLADLAPEEEIEIVCRLCCKSYMTWPTDLMAKRGFKHLYMAEVQSALKCRDKRCPGAVKVAIQYDHLVRKFTGGMVLPMKTLK